MKLYRLTFITSLCIFCSFFLLSVFLNYFVDSPWTSFFENWLIGIACSSIVVSVTTLIQYKYEQRKTVNRLIQITHSMFWIQNFTGKAVAIDFPINKIADKDFEIGENNWKTLINNAVSKIQSKLSNFDTFTKNGTLKNLRQVISTCHFSILDSEITYEQKAIILRANYKKISECIIEILTQLFTLTGKKELCKIIETDINLQKEILAKIRFP